MTRRNINNTSILLEARLRTEVEPVSTERHIKIRAPQGFCEHGSSSCTMRCLALSKVFRRDLPWSGHGKTTENLENSAKAGIDAHDDMILCIQNII